MTLESLRWYLTHRRTFNPIEDKIEILRKLEEVAEELEGDMAEKGWAGRTITLKFKRSTYEGEERSGSSFGLRHLIPGLR
jgi:hypothetical protein